MLSQLLVQEEKQPGGESHDDQQAQPGCDRRERRVVGDRFDSTIDDQPQKGDSGNRHQSANQQEDRDQQHLGPAERPHERDQPREHRPEAHGRGARIGFFGSAHVYHSACIR